MSVSDIRGRRVLDRAGNNVGNVEDATFDPEALRLTGFIIKVDREAADRLHLDHPVMGNARIQVGTERLQTIGDNILLNLDQREMAGMLYEDRTNEP